MIPHSFFQNGVFSKWAARATWLSFALLVSQTAYAKFTVSGRVLDAEASTRAFHSGLARGEEWYVPLAQKSIEIALQAEGVTRSWTTTTDTIGKFQLDVPDFALPGGARLVAKAQDGPDSLFSASFEAGTDLEVFVYRTTDRTEDLRTDFRVVYEVIAADAKEKSQQNIPPELKDTSFLRVRMRLAFTSRSPRLYVGSTAASGNREVFRVPIPNRAVVIRNQGPIPGLQWTLSKDNRWAVIDEPAPGFPDFALAIKKEQASGQTSGAWWFEYWVPARQESAVRFDFPVPTYFVVYSEKNRVSTQNHGQLSGKSAVSTDPFTREEKQYEGQEAKAELGANSSVVYGLQVDSAAIGEVSFYAIKWHGGFVVVSIVAILLGLLIGAGRRTPQEALAGLNQDELLDRLVALDRSFEQKRIAQADYEAYRGALVELISAGLSRKKKKVDAPSQPDATPESSNAGVSSAAEGLLSKIQDLEAEEMSPESIQQRAHLLEALY
ncbi:MAG: hypothetical protein AAF517_18250, partial [Planctomycetota bacterium]